MILNPYHALRFVNVVLELEEQSFWLIHILKPQGLEALKKKSLAHDVHIYAHALKAIGIWKPNPDLQRPYEGSSLVDMESAEYVCRYYLSEDNLCAMAASYRHASPDVRDLLMKALRKLLAEALPMEKMSLMSEELS
ncbi:MAG: hypothetical protein EOP06_02325 [Proteobacteria bacterium]|nr:MAG: hypothetical protein EOP06_02325 [Pseudomonadota bacterium]